MWKNLDHYDNFLDQQDQRSGWSARMGMKDEIAYYEDELVSHPEDREYLERKIGQLKNELNNSI